MDKIFSTKERVKILKTVIFDSNPISISDIASALKISKGLVFKYFNILLKEGIARKINGKYHILDNKYTKGIKILLNLLSINASPFKKYDFVEAAGLYGSCAKGENTKDSDMDIWIRINDTDDTKIALLNSQIKKNIQKVKPLFLTNKRIEKIRKEDQLFYHSLFFGTIMIYGESDAIQL